MLLAVLECTECGDADGTGHRPVSVISKGLPNPLAGFAGAAHRVPCTRELCNRTKANYAHALVIPIFDSLVLCLCHIRPFCQHESNETIAPSSNSSLVPDLLHFVTHSRIDRAHPLFSLLLAFVCAHTRKSLLVAIPSTANACL